MAKPISNHAQHALPITACAAVTACGIGTRALHDGLLHNVHRLRVPRLFALDFATYVGEVADELPALTADSVAFDTRNARLALAAMQHAPDGLLPALAEAVERYGSDRIGVVIGTSTSGMYETEQAFAHRHEHGRFPDHYHFERQHAWNATADFIRSYLQLGSVLHDLDGVFFGQQGPDRRPAPYPYGCLRRRHRRWCGFAVSPDLLRLQEPRTHGRTTMHTARP